jgi:two-component system, chemotaxis family, chemotaxis protein CheY
MALDLSMPILVVDDNPSVLGVLVLLLQKIGFTTVDDAADGATALAKMHQKKYGLVISDWQMQPMDGHNLLKQVRSTKALAGIPFIMVTVSLEAKKVISAKQAGVSGYIMKPFSAGQLRAKIKHAIAARERAKTVKYLPQTIAAGETPDDRARSAQRVQQEVRRSLLLRLRRLQRDARRGD